MSATLETLGLMNLLRDEFEFARPWIEAAVAHTGGTHTAEDVLNGILNGHLVLWATCECCAVTEIEFYPRRKNCHIFLAGGNLKALSELLGQIEKYAREMGCSAVTLTGRKGWARTFLAGRGYEEKWITLARDLREEVSDGQRQQADHHQ